MFQSLYQIKKNNKQQTIIVYILVKFKTNLALGHSLMYSVTFKVLINIYNNAPK